MSAALQTTKLFWCIPSRIQTHNYFHRPDPYSGAVIQLRFMGTHLGYESNIRFPDLESGYTSNYATETFKNLNHLCLLTSSYDFRLVPSYLKQLLQLGNLESNQNLLIFSQARTDHLRYCPKLTGSAGPLSTELSLTKSSIGLFILLPLKSRHLFVGPERLELPMCDTKHLQCSPMPSPVTNPNQIVKYNLENLIYHLSPS